MEFDDQQMMEIALLENIQREDLNAIEEAKAYEKLIKKARLYTGRAGFAASASPESMSPTRCDC